MAGHSKWANIQHRKGRQDEKRGKIWTKLIKEITVAAKLGDDDLSANPPYGWQSTKQKMPICPMTMYKEPLLTVQDPLRE